MKIINEILKRFTSPISTIQLSGRVTVQDIGLRNAEIQAVCQDVNEIARGFVDIFGNYTLNVKALPEKVLKVSAGSKRYRFFTPNGYGFELPSVLPKQITGLNFVAEIP